VAGILLEGVTKAFAGGVLAVDDVTLEIAPGEFLVLVGPSGCGKSTLLRMIAGLEEATGGTIRIDGADVTDLPPRSRDIAMVFQTYALYPHMSVRDNLAYGLKVRKTGKAETARRVEEVAQLLGLEDLLERRPAALSGGQRQRVAMGRAIVREPKAFLMDEPLSNLDAKLRVQMRADIKKLQTDLGVTTIYVTHDQVEAMTMGDRVAVMRRGELQQVAPPEELYERPANVFVAGFIGSPAMNILEARIENGSALVGDVRVPVRAADGDVLIGVRPEAFEDGALAPAGAPRLRGRVELREALGSEVLVHFSTSGRLASTDDLRELAEDMGDDRAAERATLVGRFSPKTRVHEGDAIEVAIDVDALHVFDRQTGVALAAR
jgi:multiple sugar transport system ATP-binding protein